MQWFGPFVLDNLLLGMGAIFATLWKNPNLEFYLRVPKYVNHAFII